MMTRRRGALDHPLRRVRGRGRPLFVTSKRDVVVEQLSCGHVRTCPPACTAVRHRCIDCKRRGGHE